MTETPNPGSDEAVAAGCTCPVLDNNRGKRAPFPSLIIAGADGWWVSGDCRIHSPTRKQVQAVTDHHFGDGCVLQPKPRKPWSPVVTQGPHWAQYRLQLDIADLIRLRDALGRLDLVMDGRELFDIYRQLDAEVQAIPADHLELIRQEQQQ